MPSSSPSAGFNRWLLRLGGLLLVITGSAACSVTSLPRGDGAARDGEGSVRYFSWDELRLTPQQRELAGDSAGRGDKPRAWDLFSGSARAGVSSEDEAPALTSGRLSLRESMERSLRQNLDTRIRVVEGRAAATGIARAQAEFDPYFTAQVSEGAWALSQNRNAGVQVGRRLTSGTELFVESGSRTEDSLRIDERLGQSASSPDLGLRVRQPLLRGAGRDYNEAGIERAKLVAETADQATVGQALLTLRLTETVYWSAAVAAHKVSVQEGGVTRTEKVLEDVKHRHQLGNASRLDLLEAEAAMARARESLVRARKAHEDELDNLRFVMGAPLHGKRAAPTFDAVTREFDRKPPPDPDAAYERALENAPESIILAKEVAQRRIDLFRAKRGVLPRLDLEVDARNGGQFAASRGEDWEALVSLRFSMPWGRREQRADFEEAQARLEAGELSREQGLRELRRDLHEVARRISSGRDELAAVSHGLEVQRAKWTEQLQQHREGLSTTRQLMEAEDELRQAETSEAESRLRLIAAWSTLSQLEGSIATRHGLEFTPATLAAQAASAR